MVTQIIDLVSLTEVMIELNILGLFSVLARKAGDTLSRGRPPVPAQASEAVPGHHLDVLPAAAPPSRHQRLERARDARQRRRTPLECVYPRDSARWSAERGRRTGS